MFGVDHFQDAVFGTDQVRMWVKTTVDEADRDAEVGEGGYGAGGGV